ncbi:MAG TPA: DUF5719 family protein [Acidimicrobiia bacterium]|nr:DUF5719 family protein [Acidimicrobiia bacterium]
MTETGPVRRGLVVLVVGGVLAAAAIAGEAVKAPRPEAAFATRPDAVLAGPLVPPANTLSTAWYCAAGNADGEGFDEMVAVVNAGEEPVRASVTVLSDGTVEGRERVEVKPRSRVQVRVADVAPVANPGVVVEIFGGGAAVEHVLEGGGDLATSPCARRPSTRWMFAGGTTVRGARDELHLLNPFDEDAIVDMAFYSEDGASRPQDLQAFVVPARSRVSVMVHDHVLRKRLVAAEVQARVGRIVAERTTQFTGGGGRRGLALALGATESAPNWAFPEGLVGARVIEEIWIFNPGRTDTEVEVTAEPADGGVAEPQVVPVPSRSAVAVRINKVLEEGAHAVFVQAIGSADVVAQQAIVARTGSPRIGFSVAPGIPRASTRWVFPAGSADDVHDEWITVRNPGAEDVSFTISVLAGGVALVPEGLGNLTVEAGSRRAVRMGDALKRSDLPVLVEAEAPLEAVRGFYRATEGVSVEPGIPFERDVVASAERSTI